MQTIEVVAGHDGALRGPPEVALLLGLYRAGPGPATLLGRQLIRLDAVGATPLGLKPPEVEPLEARIVVADGERLALVGVALEEDGGSDVQRLYAALAEPERLRLWEGDAPVPSPAALEDVALAAGVQRVHAILEGVDLAQLCRDDELVGVCLCVRAPRRGSEDLRLRFRSSDARNDWTALVRLTVR